MNFYWEKCSCVEFSFGGPDNLFGTEGVQISPLCVVSLFVSCNVLVGNATAYLKSELLGRRGVVFLAHLGEEGFFFGS